MKGNACRAIRAGADQWRGLTKTGKKKGNANQLESLFALTPLSLFPLITCSLRVIRAGYTTTKVVALYSQPGGAPDTPPPNQLSLGLYKTKILHMKRNWNKNQYAYLICLCLPLFFYTITVAFTKGPHPLVGCYSIFKHHSAESQPPHRPALRTCNKLSSSETTETSRAEAGQGHFNESHLINIFIFA